MWTEKKYRVHGPRPHFIDTPITSNSSILSLFQNALKSSHVVSLTTNYFIDADLLCEN